MPNDERNLQTIPDGALGLIPLESCKELGCKVDQYLVGWRERDCISMNPSSLSVITAAAPTLSPRQFRVSEPEKRRVSSRNPSAAMTYT